MIDKEGWGVPVPIIRPTASMIAENVEMRRWLSGTLSKLSPSVAARTRTHEKAVRSGRRDWRTVMVDGDDVRLVIHDAFAYVVVRRDARSIVLEVVVHRHSGWSEGGEAPKTVTCA